MSRAESPRVESAARSWWRNLRSRSFCWSAPVCWSEAGGHVESVDPGFRPERVLSMQLSHAGLQRHPRSGPTSTTACSNRLNRSPAWRAPASSANFSSAAARNRSSPPKGTPEPFPSACGSEETRSATDSSRRSGLLCSEGASFRPRTGPILRAVAIINDAMARRLWPGRDPVGKRFKLGPRDSDSPWFTVVGVVGDMRRQGLENEPIPQMFEPLAQNPSRLATLLVRTSTG